MIAAREGNYNENSDQFDCSVSGLFAGELRNGISAGRGFGGIYRPGAQRQCREGFFRGNGLTPPESVHSYILRRCAELTIEDGYSYFVLVHIQAPSAETDNLYSMKIETATIEMYPGIKPQHLANAYDAISTLRTILAEQGESEEPLPSSVVASDDKVASANAVALSAARSTTVANPNPNALTNEAVQFDHW